jgi:hypothetical protein
MNYTLEETEDGGVVLARDNLIVQCPYQQEDVNCGSWCAVFFFSKNQQGVNINLGCTQAPTIYINNDEA